MPRLCALSREIGCTEVKVLNDLLMSLQDVMQQELAAYKDMLSKARQKKRSPA